MDPIQKTHRPSNPAPIFNNNLFKPSSIDSAFRLWFRNGVKTIKDLHEDKIFSSFTKLS